MYPISWLSDSLLVPSRAWCSSLLWHGSTVHLLCIFSTICWHFVHCFFRVRGLSLKRCSIRGCCTMRPEYISCDALDISELHFLLFSAMCNASHWCILGRRLKISCRRNMAAIECPPFILRSARGCSDIFNCIFVQSAVHCTSGRTSPGSK